MSSLVVNNNTLININTWICVGWFIKNFTFEWVLDVVGDIIKGECNDSVLTESILFQNLVCVINVSLVPIIGVSVRSCDQYGPVATSCNPEE